MATARRLPFAECWGIRSRPMRRLLPLLLLVPSLALGEESRRSEVDLLGGSSRPSSTEEPPQDPTPEVPAATPVDAQEPSVAEAAALRLQEALDRLVRLEIALQQPVPPSSAALEELRRARQAVQASLVDVGRLAEQADLRALLGGGEPAAPRDAQPLADVELRALVAAIEEANFTADKMQLLTRRLADGWVTTGQAALLVEAFPFSKDRVDALLFLHPRLVDPGNFDELLAQLNFESDRQAVRDQLGLEG
jgi:hypothetical protein